MAQKCTGLLLALHNAISFWQPYLFYDLEIILQVKNESGNLINVPIL